MFTSVLGLDVRIRSRWIIVPVLTLGQLWVVELLLLLPRWL